MENANGVQDKHMSAVNINEIISKIREVDINALINENLNKLNTYEGTIPKNLNEILKHQLMKINFIWGVVRNIDGTKVKNVKRAKDKYGRDIMTIYVDCCTIKYFDGHIEIRFKELIEGDGTIIHHMLEDELRRMYLGFRVSDGYRNDDYPGMETTQLWQAILFALITGGRIYVQVRGVIIKDQGVSILWRIISYSMKEKYRSKKRALDELLKAVKIKDKNLPYILLAVILGDGGVEALFNNRDAKVYITCGKDYVDKWRTIINELINMLKISHYYEDDAKTAYSFVFSSGNAKRIVEFIINGLSQDTIKLLDSLFIEKWDRMKKILTYNWKYRRGEDQVNIFGTPISVSLYRYSEIILKKTFTTEEDTRIFINLLKENGLQECEIEQKGRKIIIHDQGVKKLIKQNPELKDQIRNILLKKLERTKSRDVRFKIRRALRDLDNYSIN